MAAVLDAHADGARGVWDWTKKSWERLCTKPHPSNEGKACAQLAIGELIQLAAARPHTARPHWSAACSHEQVPDSSKRFDMSAGPQPSSCSCGELP